MKTTVTLPMHFKLFGLSENYWDGIKSLLLGSALLAPNHLPSHRETMAEAGPQFSGSANQCHKVRRNPRLEVCMPSCLLMPPLSLIASFSLISQSEKRLFYYKKVSMASPSSPLG